MNAPQNQRLLYVSLVVSAAVGPLAMNMFVPSLPGLVEDLQTTTAIAQLTLTLYLFGTALSQLVYGPLSDRFGRRPMMLVGMSIFVTTSLLCAFAQNIETLFLARMLQSFGASAGMVLTRAIIRDLHDESASASVLGYITMAWVVAPMVAPAVGGYLDGVAGWRASFYVLAGFGAVALTVSLLFLPETNKGQAVIGARARFQAYGRLLGNPAYVFIVMTLAASSGIFFAFLGGAPHITLKVLGHTPFEYGLWSMFVAVGYMAGNFMSGVFTRRVGTTNMVIAGLVLALIGTSTCTLATLTGNLTALVLFASMGIVAIGNGICLPSANAMSMSVDTRVIGAATGLAGFLQAASGAAAAQLVGIFQSSDSHISIWIMMGSSILAIIAFPLALTARNARTC